MFKFSKKKSSHLTHLCENLFCFFFCHLTYSYFLITFFFYFMAAKFIILYENPEYSLIVRSAPIEKKAVAVCKWDSFSM